MFKEVKLAVMRYKTKTNMAITEVIKITTIISLTVIIAHILP